MNHCIGNSIAYNTADRNKHAKLETVSCYLSSSFIQPIIIRLSTVIISRFGIYTRRVLNLRSATAAASGTTHIVHSLKSGRRPSHLPLISFLPSRTRISFTPSCCATVDIERERKFCRRGQVDNNINYAFVCSRPFSNIIRTKKKIRHFSRTVDTT